MDTGASVRASGVTQAAYVRPEQQSVRNETVKTDLAREQAVTVREDVIATKLEKPSIRLEQRTPQAPIEEEKIHRKIELDPETNAVIMKLTNSNGQVITQIPSEETIKLRAYVKSLLRENENNAPREKEIVA